MDLALYALRLRSALAEANLRLNSLRQWLESVNLQGEAAR